MVLWGELWEGGAVAQMCGKLFVEGAVWGLWPSVVGKLWGGGSCVGKLLGGATHVAGLLHSFVGELCGGAVCVRAGLGELWRGGGELWQAALGAWRPCILYCEPLKTPRRCVGTCVSGVCKLTCHPLNTSTHAIG